MDCRKQYYANEVGWWVKPRVVRGVHTLFSGIWVVANWRKQEPPAARVKGEVRLMCAAQVARRKHDM